MMKIRSSIAAGLAMSIFILDCPPARRRKVQRNAPARKSTRLSRAPGKSDEGGSGDPGRGKDARNRISRFEPGDKYQCASCAGVATARCRAHSWFGWRASTDAITRYAVDIS